MKKLLLLFIIIPFLSFGQSVFEKIYDCTGIDLNLDEQLEYLHKVFPKYHTEYTPTVNTGLSLVDAFALYAMIREKKPKVMIDEYLKKEGINLGDDFRIKSILKSHVCVSCVNVYFSLKILIRTILCVLCQC